MFVCFILTGQKSHVYRQNVIQIKMKNFDFKKFWQNKLQLGEGRMTISQRDVIYAAHGMMPRILMIQRSILDGLRTAHREPGSRVPPPVSSIGGRYLKQGLNALGHDSVFGLCKWVFSTGPKVEDARFNCHMFRCSRFVRVFDDYEGKYVFERNPKWPLYREWQLKLAELLSGKTREERETAYLNAKRRLAAKRINRSIKRSRLECVIPRAAKALRFLIVTEKWQRASRLARLLCKVSACAYTFKMGVDNKLKLSSSMTRILIAIAHVIDSPEFYGLSSSEEEELEDV
jgi:hypothetical protein